MTPLAMTSTQWRSTYTVTSRPNSHILQLPQFRSRVIHQGDMSLSLFDEFKKRYAINPRCTNRSGCHWQSCQICIGMDRVRISTRLPAILVVSMYASVSLGECRESIFKWGMILPFKVRNHILTYRGGTRFEFWPHYKSWWRSKFSSCKDNFP
jgi:hypothetical protein